MDRVAVINSVFGFSSTGTLMKQLFEYGHKKRVEVFAFYGRGHRIKDKHIIRIDCGLEVCIHKTLTLITGYQGRYSMWATNYLIRKLKENHINKVILLNLHGYYLNEKRILSYLKENKIQTVYVTPDEYAGLGKCCFSKDCMKFKSCCNNCPYIRDYPKSLFFDRSNEIFNMKKEIYENFNTLTIIGPEINIKKFQESTLLRDKPMKTVSWGVDLELYKYKINDKLYDKYNIPNDKVLILTVASYNNARKGVKQYFFALAKRLEKTRFHFINVGYDGNLSKEEIPENMTTIGYLDDQTELSQLYSVCDLYLLASTTDTMPLSCLISFACETPVCCFYTSGLKYLAPKDHPAIIYCEDISIDGLESVVRRINKKDKNTMKACRQLAIEEYSTEAFCRKVYDAFDVSKQ